MNNTRNEIAAQGKAVRAKYDSLAATIEAAANDCMVDRSDFLMMRMELGKMGRQLAALRKAWRLA